MAIAMSPADTVKDKLTKPPITELQAAELLERLENGETVLQASKAIGISRQTSHRLIARYRANLAAAKNLLALKAMTAAENWVQAAAVAAEKGDHRPAKEWLETIRAVDPVNAERSSGVTIIIGTPDKPIANPAQIIDLSPALDE